MKSDEELLAELKQATNGLFVMSESDYPVEVLFLNGEEELSPQFLRQLAGADAAALVETRSFDEFFRSTTFETISNEGGQLKGAPGGHTLFSLLKDNLTDLHVYRIGKINIPVYLIGQSREGNWIGLSTRVVET